jgi:hypothetical protein
MAHRGENITAHIINHTHWDREWFLTSVYTSQWIPGLIDTLEQLVADNPGYTFLLDGQTLVIEDLIGIAPAYRARAKRLIENGNLIVGPYYCQPDWQITGGELLIRNLMYGWQDMQAYGGSSSVGWLVDTFGHISQTPQLHRLFNLRAVYVWRGIPRLEPYFEWLGADGESLFTVNLFGGYRNLYGVTHTPGIAIRRLEAETTKLRPFYPTPDIPLFDGYDLEQNPEDPVRFYRQEPDKLPVEIQIRASSPAQFADELCAKLDRPPRIVGELNSGKYGAVFPGTLSTRTYLKVMHSDCEHLLYQRCEPLAALAYVLGRAYNGQQYETWGRMLLQNSVHDCICGVSVDQVHEKMELGYKEVFQAAQEDIDESLAHILHDFVPGIYAVSTNPCPSQSWQTTQDTLYCTESDGIGVWPVVKQVPVERPDAPIETLEWQNDHYTAVVKRDGTVQVGAAVLGRLVVSEERGDTYSDEAGGWREQCQVTGPLVVEQRSSVHSVVRYGCTLQWGKRQQVSAVVRLVFDPSPFLRWQVDLNSRGTNFKVELVFETAQSGQLCVGMPFDMVKRQAVDQDLLPRQLEDRLAKVLLGQRELDAVRTFPFHDFVAICGERPSAVVFAKGIRAYQASDSGTISLTLRRSIEWLTAPDLQYRAGDAGPFMYVPDARCERTVRHEIAVVIGEAAVDDLAIHQLNAAFQNPPLIVESQGKGEQTAWRVLQENLPLTGLCLYTDRLLARFYNPTGATRVLGKTYRKTDAWGNPEATLAEVWSGQIVTVETCLERSRKVEQSAPLDLSSGSPIVPVVGPAWRVGDNQGVPDPKIIEQLEKQIAQLEGQLAAIEAQLSNGGEQHLLQHRYYILKRVQYEARLSAQLNRHKLKSQGHEYLYTPVQDITELGTQLNQLRIKRRIYDYVVEAL